MRRPTACASLFAMASLSVFAQSPGAPPAFEVASVKPAPPPTGHGFSSSTRIDPGRITFSNVSLKDMIQNAYRVKDYQVTGPDWIANERFDVVATMPADAPKDSVGPMLQTLLADRFKLTLHRDTKEVPVYALVVGKSGPKLKETPEGGVRGRTNTSRDSGSITHLVANGVKVSNLADMLARFVGRPVLDMTELKDEYDFKLDFAQDESPISLGEKPGMKTAAREGGEARLAENAEGPSIFAALQEQLGLKLEARKGPVENLVIDHVEKVPTEN